METRTKKQEEAFYLATEKRQNIFLTGGAGTGKSFLLRQIEENLSARRFNVVRVAPTGLAAFNIGGATIHSLFHVPPKPLSPQEPLPDDEEISEAVIYADVIMIDEISMCRFDIFEYIMRYISRAERLHYLQTNPWAPPEDNDSIPKQIIISGDFFQLPSVLTNEDKQLLASLWDKDITKEDIYAFVAPEWEKLKFTIVELDEIVRQEGNEEFCLALNQLRKGDTASIDYFASKSRKTKPKEAISIVGSNREADSINNRNMKRLDSEEVIFKAEQSGSVPTEIKELPVPQIVKLKSGCRVRITANLSSKVKNGFLGYITDISEDEIVTVQLDTGEEAKITKHEFLINNYTVREEEKDGVVNKIVELEPIGSIMQIPLAPAYAVTVHRSQGQTYETAIVTPEFWDFGQLYVALSRVKKIKGLFLKRPITPDVIKVSKQVKKFYNSMI